MGIPLSPAHSAPRARLFTTPRPTAGVVARESSILVVSLQAVGRSQQADGKCDRPTGIALNIQLCVSVNTTQICSSRAEAGAAPGRP
jgi:hypothetical protein